MPLPAGGPDPRPESHPDAAELERFVRGELPREEARAVVCHLLTGCEVCRQVTGRLWRLGDGPFSMQGGDPFMTDIESAQAQLREIVRELEAIRFRLLGVEASLPPSSTETLQHLEVELTDQRAALRTVIQCVLSDSLAPAIGDLRDVADYAEEE